MTDRELLEAAAKAAATRRAVVRAAASLAPQENTQ